ncbi:MAG: DUF4190 domain-containing protein [Planctomycetes bacterium]|nr:DUF4190 domain-containing protein [Planctomycetota bacterium]
MAGGPYNQQGGYPQQPQQPGGYQQQPGGYQQQGGYQQNQYPPGGNYPQGQYPGAAQGQPYGQPYPGQNPQMGVTPGLVTAGFILAIIPCTSFIGLILSAIGLMEAKKRQAGEGLAIAGIIIGAVWQVLGIVGWVMGNVSRF